MGRLVIGLALTRPKSAAIRGRAWGAPKGGPPPFRFKGAPIGAAQGRAKGAPKGGPRPLWVPLRRRAPPLPTAVGATPSVPFACGAPKEWTTNAALCAGAACTTSEVPCDLDTQSCSAAFDEAPSATIACSASTVSTEVAAAGAMDDLAQAVTPDHNWPSVARSALAEAVVASLVPLLPGINEDWIEVRLTATALSANTQGAIAPRLLDGVKVVFQINIPATASVTPDDALAAGAAVARNPGALAAKMNLQLSPVFPQHAGPIVSTACITVASPSFQSISPEYLAQLDLGTSPHVATDDPYLPHYRTLGMQYSVHESAWRAARRGPPQSFQQWLQQSCTTAIDAPPSATVACATPIVKATGATAALSGTQTRRAIKALLRRTGSRKLPTSSEASESSSREDAGPSAACLAAGWFAAAAMNTSQGLGPTATHLPLAQWANGDTLTTCTVVAATAQTDKASIGELLQLAQKSPSIADTRC